MKYLLLIAALSASGQSFTTTTNTVIAPVGGRIWFTTDDNTNWIPLLVNTVRFEMPQDTNTTPPPPPVPASSKPYGVTLLPLRAKLTNAVATARTQPMPAIRAARSTSDSDTVDTWSIVCPHCRSNFNMALKLNAPTVEVIK